MKPKPPCYGCPDRTFDCHSGNNCPKWVAYRDQCDALAAEKERDDQSNYDTRIVRRGAGKRRRYPHVT